MRSKLSILQVNSTDLGGGAAAVAFSLHNAFRERGHRSRLAVGVRRSVDPDVFEIPNADARNSWARAFENFSEKLTPIVGRVRGADRARGLLRSMGSPASALQKRLGHEDFDFPGTWRLLNFRGEKPEVIHLHNLHGGYFDLTALPSIGSAFPTVITLHDEWLLTGHCAYSFGCGRWEKGCGSCPDLTITPAIRRDATAENWRRKRATYERSNLAIVAPSHWLLDRAQRSILAQGATKTQVIHNGVDQEVFQPGDKIAARERLGIPGDTAVIMFAANGIRGNMFKDYPSIQTAISTLSSQLHDGQFIFLGVGDNGPNEDFGRGSIRFIPHVADRRTLADYYRAADVYMHAARAENFPNTILEALSCGTPVVATAVGGIPEQIRALVIPEKFAVSTAGMANGDATGILTPPGDGEQLGTATAWLIQHPDVLGALGRNAAADARQRFSLDRMADNYLALYNTMIAERTAAATELQIP